MLDYRYRRTVIRDGAIVHDAVMSIDSAAVYMQASKLGHVSDCRFAFYKLVNHWNAIGLLGVPNGGPMYVYTVEA